MMTSMDETRDSTCSGSDETKAKLNPDTDKGHLIYRLTGCKAFAVCHCPLSSWVINKVQQ